MIGKTDTRSKKRTIFGVSSALLMVALLVLSVVLLTVGCGGGSSDPEATVQKFLTALENKDMDAVLELMDPATVATMESDATAAGQSMDDIEALLAAEFFAFDSVKFENIKMETTETGEDTATVTIVEGSVTQTVDGVETTEDVKDSEEPAEFPVVLIDGTWYVDFGSL